MWPVPGPHDEHSCPSEVSGAVATTGGAVVAVKSEGSGLATETADGGTVGSTVVVTAVVDRADAVVNGAGPLIKVDGKVKVVDGAIIPRPSGRRRASLWTTTRTVRTASTAMAPVSSFLVMWECFPLSMRCQPTPVDFDVLRHARSTEDQESARSAWTTFGL